MGINKDVNQPCPCGSGLKFKKCCKDYTEIRNQHDTNLEFITNNIIDLTTQISSLDGIQISPLIKILTLICYLDYLSNIYIRYVSDDKKTHTHVTYRLKEYLNKFVFTPNNKASDHKFIQDCTTDIFIDIRHNLVHYMGVGDPNYNIPIIPDSLPEEQKNSIFDHLQSNISDPTILIDYKVIKPLVVQSALLMIGIWKGKLDLLKPYSQVEKEHTYGIQRVFQQMKEYGSTFIYDNLTPQAHPATK